MAKLFQWLSLFFPLIVHGNQVQSYVELRSVLRAEINSIHASIPGNTVGHLVQGLTATANSHADTVEQSQLSAKLSTMKVPSSAVQKFNEIVLAESVKFQSFSVHFVCSASNYQVFVGAARRSGTSVDFAYISAVSSGKLIQQTQRVSHCHHCFLVAKCCHHQTENRGFTTQETQNIELALEATAHSKLVASLPKDSADLATRPYGLGLTDFFAEDAPKADPLALLKKALASETAELAALEEELKSKSKTELVQTIVSRGFTYFDQTGDVQQISGVDEDKLTELFTMVGSDIQMPQEFAAGINEALMECKMFDSNEWHMWQFAFSVNAGGTCRYATVLSRRDEQTNKYDFFIANFAAQFTFAPDLFIYNTKKSFLGGLFGSSKLHVVKRPHIISTEDAKVLFDFFDIVAYQKFAAVLKIPIAVEAKEAKEAYALTIPEDDPPSGGSLLDNAINSVLGEWNKIVSSLKSSSKTSITQELMNRGYKSFLNAGQVQKGDGLPEHFLPDFIKQLNERLKIPAERQQDFHDVLQEVQWFDDNTWVMWKVAFDMNHQGQAKYVCLLSRHRQQDKKYDFLVADIEQEFAFAPDLFIMKQSKSILGGIWSSEKVKFKYTPHPATTADINFVFDYFTLVAFKRFAQVLNLANDIPDDPFAPNATSLLVV